MTAVTATEAAPIARRPHAEASRIPLTRITRIELRKMFDTRSGFWLLMSIAITAVIATAALIAFADDDELTYESFGSAIGFPTAVILPVIGILAVTSEWSQRSHLTTFTYVPDRNRVILAKAIAVIGVGVVSMLVAFAIGALGNLIGTAIAGTDQVWDVTALDVAHVILGNVLGMMMAFAVGLLLRSSPAAVVTYFVYAFVLPGLTELLAVNQEWFTDVRGWIDVNYAQAPLFGFNDGSVTAEQWAHIGVTHLIWLVLPLLVALRLLRRSEIA